MRQNSEEHIAIEWYMERKIEKERTTSKSDNRRQKAVFEFYSDWDCHKCQALVGVEASLFRCDEGSWRKVDLVKEKGEGVVFRGRQSSHRSSVFTISCSKVEDIFFFWIRIRGSTVLGSRQTCLLAGWNIPLGNGAFLSANVNEKMPRVMYVHSVTPTMCKARPSVGTIRLGQFDWIA